MKNFLFFLVIITNAFLYGENARERLGFQKADPVKIERLVAGQYFGAYRLGYGAGQYLNNTFGLSSISQDTSLQSFTWINEAGSYPSYNLHGYWIFRTNIHQCWQAVNANGPLVLWNKDGKAKGNPEDWELFVYEFADSEHSSVFVKNIWGRYVRYASPHFVCDSNQANAAAFYPEF